MRVFISNGSTRDPGRGERSQGIREELMSSQLHARGGRRAVQAPL